MTLSCLSVAFFITSEYTRFFSPEEALRIKSENGVDLTVLNFENMDIILNLRQTAHHDAGRSVPSEHSSTI